MSLVQLTYVSVATRPMLHDDLVQILKTARENNTKQNITGMLLYRDDYFIQALEGEREVVRDLFQLISKDDRHSHVLEVGVDKIAARDFDDWSMGFSDLNADGVDLSNIEGFSNYMNQEINVNFFADKSRAKTLLRVFKNRTTF